MLTNRYRGLGVAVATGFVVGCTPPPAPPPLTIWHNLPSVEARVLDQQAASLREQHPDWQLTLRALPTGPVTARFGTLEGPDAALVPLAVVPQLIHDRRLLALDAHLSERDRLDFIPAAWRAVTADNHVWALPFEVSCLGVYHRRSLLAGHSVPATVSDVLAAGVAYKKTHPTQAFLSLPTDAYTLLPLLWAHGGSPVPDKAWRTTTQFLLTLRSRQVIGPFHRTPASSIGVLSQGRAAMAIGGPEHLAGLRILSASGELGIAPVPGGSDSGQTPMIGRAWVISPRSTRLDAAVAAVKALGGTAGAAAWGAHLSRPPARLSAYEHPDIKQRPLLAAFRDLTADARVMTVSDLDLVTTLDPAWRPYLMGQKRLEMPKPPVLPKGAARRPLPQPGAGTNGHRPHRR